MIRVLLRTFALVLFSVGYVVLCQPSQGWSETPKRSRDATRGPAQAPQAESAFKKTLMLEYISWFEKLVFVSDSGSQSGVKAINYGFSGTYDVTKYLPKWGWGGNIGLGQGYAVGQGDTTTYQQKRVSWTVLRAGGRVFRRLNGRTDLGLNLILMQKTISWPIEGGTVSPGPSPLISSSVEIRWRMTRRWEMIQALGNSVNDAGASLRFGFGFTF